jgi:hypothetical protein
MKEMTKSHIFIFVELLHLIIDFETEWKTKNSTWLTQKEVKKFKKKKSRVKKNDDDDEKMKIIVNSSKQSWKNDDFVSFKNDDDDNAKHAKNAKYANMRNMSIMISQSMTLMLNFCPRIFLITCIMNKHFKHIWSFIWSFI